MGTLISVMKPASVQAQPSAARLAGFCYCRTCFSQPRQIHMQQHELIQMCVFRRGGGGRSVTIMLANLQFRGWDVTLCMIIGAT